MYVIDVPGDNRNGKFQGFTSATPRIRDVKLQAVNFIGNQVRTMASNDCFVQEGQSLEAA
jgi:hypothetical protein